jgi:hypothetical protein
MDWGFESAAKSRLSHRPREDRLGAVLLGSCRFAVTDHCLLLTAHRLPRMGLGGLALKAPRGAFIPNAARHARGVRLHHRPHAYQAWRNTPKFRRFPEFHGRLQDLSDTADWIPI